jgi:hypothetical protein
MHAVGNADGCMLLVVLLTVLLRIAGLISGQSAVTWDLILSHSMRRRFGGLEHTATIQSAVCSSLLALRH